ncbi:ribonuclease H-like domain-containing protein [Tanacetum coccineum]
MSQPANDEFSQHLSDDEETNHEDASDTGDAPKQQQQVIPQTTAISNIKLPILKKEEYDIWAMEMEHYLEYIDNEVWKVIQNGNSKKRISTRKDGIVRILSPVTAAEIQAVEKERKAKNILLMAIPKEHMRRFHGMDDAKEIWEAIRTRFGGNANSKKMQKAVFKQQFEAFKISSSEGLEKGYDRFQQLLSQLEAHGAEVSTEDANHKFLRSLPAAWSNLAMTMRTKPEVDTLSIDDLYNNLRVFEQEIQGASKTSSSAQNVAFISQSKSSTNKVKSGFTGTYSTCTPSTSSTNIPEKEVPAGFADEVIYSLFAKQSEDWDLLHEDLEQIDDVDIEEMDINWQIAMIAIRMKKFYKKTGRRVRVDGKTPVGFDKKKLECFNCHNTGHFARECTAKGTHDGKKKRDSFYQHQEAGKQEKNQMGLLTMDDGIVNWGEHTAVEETNHALMAISLNNEVNLSSKTCIDSYNTLKLLYDEQMNQLGDQEAQILAYSQAVKKLEAQLVTFQKQQLSLNEKLTFQANEIYEKDEKLKRYRRIGMKAVKEKEQLQKTLDSWKDSSKNLWRLINSGMSSNSKVGLGFEIQSNNEVLSYEEEMNFSVFNCSKEDSIGKPLYSRFTKTNDFKGVPHPLSGDYTPKPQEEIDDSLYVYGKKGPQKPEISDSDDNSTEHSTCQSNDSEGSCGNTSEHSFETESESLSVPNEMSKSRLEITNEKVVSELQEVEPSCAKHVKTPRQQMKDQATPKVNRKNWNAMMEREQGEGYSFTKKKCFVCGSLSHLIKDCDYYEKKMAREAEVKKQRVVNTGNGVAKPVWTNANKVNHSNKFVPRSVQLNAGRPNTNSVRPNINTGRTNINSVRPRVNAVSSNVNTVRSRQPVPTKTSNSFSPKRPQMNQFNQRRDFSKSYSSVRRPFAKTTAQMSHSNAVKGNWGSAVKTSAGYNWRNSNCDSRPTFIRTVNAKGPQGRPKPVKAWEHPLKNMVDRGIFDSGCSGHIDNENTICIVKNPVYHSKTKHIEIRHHFIRDCYEKKLISVEKIHTDLNVADLHSMDEREECQGFAEIVDFLRGSNLRYALTANPTIYDSLVKQFWQSAIANTQPDGSLTINATIDTIRYTISEASIRESLQLEDATGITMLPNDDLFEGMGANREPSPVHQHFSPPQEQAQGQMTVDDLLQVVPQLISRIDSLETDLKQTKLTMGNALVKLVKKVKKLEGFLKRRNMVLSDSEEEEPEAQGMKSQDDPLASLVQGLVTPSMTKVNASGEEQVEDISPNTLEAAKTLSRVASLKPKSIDKGRRYKRRKETKGKKVVSSLVFKKKLILVLKKLILLKELILAVLNLVLLVNKLVLDSAKRLFFSDKAKCHEMLIMIIEETPKKSKEQILQEEASLAEAIRLDTLQKEEVAKQVHLDSLLAQRIAEEEAKDCKLCRVVKKYVTYKEEDFRKEVVDLEKKSGKREKHMARKDCVTGLDEDVAEVQMKLVKQDDIVTDNLSELDRIVMNRYGMDPQRMSREVELVFSQMETAPLWGSKDDTPE